jgi:hypothetical protein
MVPLAVTRAVVATEMVAATAWCDRHGWTVAVTEDGLHVDATTAHPVTGTVIVFHADLDGYPAIPPVWTCRDQDGHVGPATFPLPGERPGIPGSIFHGNQVICAPWSRLAYAGHGGPHSDWGDLTAWKTIAGVTQAHTIADMLNALAVHLAASKAVAA